MLALITKDKKRIDRVHLFKSQKELNKKLSRVWKTNKRVLVLEVAKVKKLKAIAVEGLWLTKT